jgi:ATP adenylyltransferase
LEETKVKIQTVDNMVTGFNIGEDAGQTIFHCHIHLIPRRKNDIENPKGGLRGVIPEKQKY